MSRVKLSAPNGKTQRNSKPEALYSEVICDEKQRPLYVVADSPEDPVVQELDGVTLGERVSDLEDAVVERELEPFESLEDMTGQE